MARLIAVVNAGSATLKLALFEARDGDVRDGSHVTVSSSDGQHHCTFTVQLAAESVMTWSHSLVRTRRRRSGEVSGATATVGQKA